MAFRRITLPDGRRLAVEDLGPADGVPVAYLHGTPDSRLARHPDDSIAGDLGIRLLAIDRPGAGDSDADPVATLTSLGDDLGELLDALGLDELALLGWSSGGLAALGVASVLGDRVTAVVLACTMPPVEAYADPVVVEALGPTRRPFAELSAELPAAELAAEVAAFLVPEDLTPELALEHVLEGAGERGRAELASVSGSAEVLARGLIAGTARGLGPIEQDLRLQLTPGLDLGAITAPVRTVHGDEDGTSPLAVGRWLCAQLPPGAMYEGVSPASHHLVFPRWATLLETARTLRWG